MPHETPLIATIALGLGLAFLFGVVANRLRLPLVAGYILAGVALGPHTPGFVGDAKIAAELAEIGVILLMFGVGLHFSLNELLSVRGIAIPGALAGMTAGTACGFALSQILGWSVGGGLVFGLALSVASTVVLTRALRDRRILETERGKIAVGWLIVEDIVTVLTLVLIPALAPLFGGRADAAGAGAASAGTAAILAAVGVTLLKLGAFLVVMLVAGRRVIPWLLHYVAYTGSRELFRLAVLAIALIVAFGAVKLFGVSFALGAFLAGMILAESTLSQQAANESLPLRDAFAVLFFVSVGMLFDPSILVRDPWTVLAALVVVMAAKPLAALGVMLASGYPLRTGLTIAVSLAQIAEFSFILAALGGDLGLLDKGGRDLILATAILSILANPVLFFAIDALKPWLDQFDRQEASAETPEPEPAAPPVTSLAGHTILIGFGRVGSRVVAALNTSERRLYVIDDDPDHVAQVRAMGIEAETGNAATLLASANPAAAEALLVAVAESFEAGQAVAEARAANGVLLIIARAHSEAEAEHLRKMGADAVVFAEAEIAAAMVTRLSAGREAKLAG